MNRMPSLDSIPVPVELVRDGIDKLMVVAAVVSAIIGIFAFVAAVVAIYIAIRAEGRSRKMIEAERERNFKLLVLRDLVNSMNAGQALPQDHSASLAMLDANDLPEWRRYSQVRREHPGDWGEVYRTFLGTSEPADTTWDERVKVVLLGDLVAAIERRMRNEADKGPA